jgi:hypothetical protein
LESLKDLKTAYSSQVNQLGLAKVVDIAQTMPAASPVQQVIAEFHICGSQADGFPGLNTRSQARAV